MANLFKNTQLISKLLAVHVENNLVMGRLANKQFQDVILNQKLGGVVQYQKPVKFTVQTGSDITGLVQDITETTGTITVATREVIPFEISSQDLTLSVEGITEKYLKPAGIQLANKIDAAGLALYDEVYNAAGTAGVTPSTFQNVSDASEILSRFAVPGSERRLVVDTKAEFGIPNGLKGLLMPSMVSGIVKEASVGRVAKLDIFGDQNVKTHTAGDFAGALVAGASQTGASVTLDTLTNSGAAQLKKGDIITMPGCNSVNPISKADTGDLQQFVLTADATVTAGAATVVLEPAIIITGATQTVTASPTDNGAVVALATHRANLAFHKDAFQLVTVPLLIPEDATGSRFEHNGISIRFMKGHNILTDIQTYRMDILYGWKLQYPEFAARLLG